MMTKQKQTGSLRFDSLLEARQIPLFLLLIMVLAVAQDFLSSQLRGTGFYISESLLYNTLWAWLIPLGYVELQLLHRIKSTNRLSTMGLSFGAGLAFTLLHTLIFAGAFTMISALVYDPSHRFYRIWTGVLSRQSYLLFFCYLLLPWAGRYLKKIMKRSSTTDQTGEKLKHIKVRSGSRTILLKTAEIQLIEADKPYIAIFTADQKYIESLTLKKLEATVDPAHFIRVHRSTIINSQYLSELKSLQNGDYEGTLLNGKVVRLSRHLRSNWERLLH